MSNAAPEGWQQSLLSDLTSKITDGSHYSPPTVQSEFRIATVENMTETHIDIGRCRTISEEEFIKLSANSCRPQVGDVLFSKDGTIGKTLVYRQFEDIVLLSSIAIIRTTESKLVPEYLEHFLSSPLFFQELENKKSGSAIRRVVLGDLRSLSIPTAPLPEQKKIASILSSVDEVIENTQKQIDKLQDLKKATMNELLTKGIGHTEFKDSELGRIPKSWEVENLSKFIRRISSGWSPVCYPEQRVNNEWAVLKTTAVVWSGYDPSENKLLPDKFAPKKAATVGDNELLITRKGPRERVGVCVSTGRTPINLMIPDTVFKLSLDDTLSSSFAALILGTPTIQRDWDRKKIGLAEAQVNINHGIINETKIPLPPEEERQKICQFINSFDLRLNALRTKFSQTHSLKKSLMQDLLTGKVRVTVN